MEHGNSPFANKSRSYDECMRRVIASVIFVSLSVAAFTQGSPKLVGVWTASKTQAKELPNIGALTISFAKDGTCHIKSQTVEADGDYKLQGSKLTITLKKRNDSSPSAREMAGTGVLVENGKALLLDSGMKRNGKSVKIRLVRKS